MYQAAILLDFHGSTSEAELQVPVERLQAALDMQLTKQSIERGGARITNYVVRNFSASLPNGQRFRIDSIDSPRFQVSKEPRM